MTPRALEAVFDRQVARDHVNDRRRHEERRNAARAALHVVFLGLFDQRQAANARTDDDADTRGIFFGDGQATVLQCLDPCSHAEMDKPIHVAGILTGDVILDIEAFDFARETGREGFCVEQGNVADARLASQGRAPRFSNRIADR
jgi:hypothetical protein